MVRLTNKEKFDVINECNQCTQSDVARKFGITRQAVSYIVSKSDSLNNLDDLSAKTPPKKDKGIAGIETELLVYINDLYERGILVKVKIIK